MGRWTHFSSMSVVPRLQHKPFRTIKPTPVSPIPMTHRRIIVWSRHIIWVISLIQEGLINKTFHLSERILLSFIKPSQLPGMMNWNKKEVVVAIGKQTREINQMKNLTTRRRSSITIRLKSVHCMKKGNVERVPNASLPMDLRNFVVYPISLRPASVSLLRTESAKNRVKSVNMLMEKNSCVPWSMTEVFPIVLSNVVIRRTLKNKSIIETRNKNNMNQSAELISPIKKVKVDKIPGIVDIKIPNFPITNNFTRKTSL